MSEKSDDMMEAAIRAVDAAREDMLLAKDSDNTYLLRKVAISVVHGALLAERQRDRWMPVKGYEGKYEVSDRGTVRKVSGTILGQWANQDGYMLVRLSDPRAVARVHRLVAEAFLPNDRGAPNVNHIDCNPSNNSFWNLEWCTQAENLAHMDSMGRRSSHWTGKRSPNAMLSDEQVSEIRRIRSDTGMSFEKLGAAFGISKRAAHRCVRGETYPILHRGELNHD